VNESRDATLHAARHADLRAFNRLVLEHQEAVYTLAYRLLGDEGAAAEATQAAFVGALREQRAGPQEPFKLSVLRWLVRACQPRLARRPPAAAGPGLAGRLAALPPAQGLAVALVDIARLDYAQAAGVLGVSAGQLACHLAAARRALGGVETM
jgi:DNA-directed RNA polymerase specialized sigma24 family protein